MVAFYKHDIAAWRGGTASLSHEQYRVYHVIVEQLMLDEGPVYIHERMLAGIANMSVRAFRIALNDLIEAGKLVRNGDQISNFRAENELKSIRNNRENAKTGGISSGNVRRKALEQTEKPNEINGSGEAPLPSDMKPKREEKTREEKTREEEKDNAHDARDGTDVPSLPGLDDPPEDLPKPRKHPWPNDAFDRFWRAYPTKIGKQAAERKFDQIRKDDRLAWDALWNGLLRYVNKRDDRPWCNPATWLHQGRWDDETTNRPTPGSNKGRYYSP